MPSWHGAQLKKFALLNKYNIKIFEIGIVDPNEEYILNQV